MNLATYQGDSLDGGDGTDTLSYASSLLSVVVLMDWNCPTSGIAWNGTSGDVMINFENLTGSTHNDVLLGQCGCEPDQWWCGHRFHLWLGWC